MEKLEEYDVVKIKALLLSESERMNLGSDNIKRNPIIGDTGTIVHIATLKDGTKKMFIVECINHDGYAYWISDFIIEELELVWKYDKK
jgi:hypothetical protein